MINYLQLGRNLQKYAPRVEAKCATYIFNPKGVYDFKQVNPVIKEALTDTFRDVTYPVLEISTKKSGTTKGVITVKEGYDEVSKDTFVLSEGVSIEDFLAETDGCMKKLTYDKEGIEKIGEQYDLLRKFLTELTAGLKNPKLEMWFKDRNKYSIGNIILKDGDRIIMRGYYSKEKKDVKPIEKFHFINEHELSTGFGYGKDVYGKKYSRLPEFLTKRLWLLEGRSKSILQKYYGIGCSPKNSIELGKKWKISASRIREIIVESKAIMKNAKTYLHELRADLDELGHILSDEERYKIYKKGSSIDINKAETKIIKYKQKKQINKK